MSITYVNSITLRNTVFANNSTINSVDCSNIPWVSNSLYKAFENCTNLTHVINIHQNVKNVGRAFYNCQNLTTIPALPENITNVESTFENCKNITVIPSIPNIASLPYTFAGTGITTIPSIPNAVTSLTGTFANCINLNVIPTIPSSITNMYNTFANCINLTGKIQIQSNNITNATNCFANTTKVKEVYIYFQDSSNIPTQTYNSFINAGYDEEGTKNGVYLKDLFHYKLNVEGFTYASDTNDNIILQTYTSTNTSVVIPNLEEA